MRISRAPGPNRLNPLLAAALGAASALSIGVAAEARGADRTDLAPTGPSAATPATPSASPVAPSQEELLRRLNALQAEVDHLKAQQQANSTAEQRLEEKRAVDATVEQVRRDAASRSQSFDLFAPNSVAIQHTDSGFKFHTNDGNFSLNPFLQFQFRYATDYRSHSTSTQKDDDTQSGFEVRRLKFGADGNLFGPDLTYFTQFAVDRSSGNTALEFVWAKYHFAGTPFSVQFGQLKDPLDHEQILASRYYAPIDRTLVADLFARGEGITKGVTLVYNNDGPFRAAGSLTSGLNNFNTNFQTFPTTGISADWGTAARAEYKFFGDWKDYDTKFSGRATDQDTLVAGAAFDYTEAGRTGTLTHVFDLEYMTRSGWLLYAAYLGRAGRDSTVGSGTSATFHNTYDATGRLSVSYAIDEHWEPYVQYEFIHFDPTGLAAKSQDEVHVLRLGTSYYFHGHNAKIQGDVSYLPNGSPVNDTGTGILQDNGHNEVVFRLQFQLLL